MGDIDTAVAILSDWRDTGAGLSDNMEQHVNWTNFNFKRFFRSIAHHARWSSSDRLCLAATLHRRPRVFYDLILSIECIPGIRQASPTSPASFAPHLFANSLRPEHTQHTHTAFENEQTQTQTKTQTHLFFCLQPAAAGPHTARQHKPLKMRKN